MIRLYETGRWKKGVVPLYALVTLITCLQGSRQVSNNIAIFRYSSFHLLAHQPLYAAYPEVYKDFFLYHPSFSVLFMPFAFLPPAAALWAWIVFSTVVFVKAVSLLPGISDAARAIILLLVLPELTNNQQYVQTNILLAALMLLAYSCFEKKKLCWAACFTILAFCIKGYGGIIGLLFLLYPGKLKFTGWALVWGLLVCALPLCFVSFSETIGLYAAWLQMISSDEIKEGLSIIGLFGKTHAAELYLSISALLLLISTLAMAYRRPGITAATGFRSLLCCYLFIWVVLFNRTAESPTYLLAITSVGCWLFADGPTRLKASVAAVILLLVYIFPSDLFPAAAHRVFKLYHLKVYPFMAYFLLLQYQIWRPSPAAGQQAAASQSL